MLPARATRRMGTGVGADPRSRFRPRGDDGCQAWRASAPARALGHIVPSNNPRSNAAPSLSEGLSKISSVIHAVLIGARHTGH